MMNYRKGRNVEEELTRNEIPIENLPEDFLWMHVCFEFISSWTTLLKKDLHLHINISNWLSNRWKVELQYQMLSNLQRKHCNLVSIVHLYGLATVEVLEKLYLVPKFWKETLHCIKLLDYAIKRTYLFFHITNIWWHYSFCSIFIVAVAVFWYRNEEFWDPIMDGLEPIVVKRKIPCVHILMSLDEIDSKTPG